MGKTGGGASRGVSLKFLIQVTQQSVNIWVLVGFSNNFSFKNKFGDMLRLDRNNTGAVGNQISFS
ncbi:MAG: hypothetical protein CM15mV142_250 [Caudoviricetes sp.]|nr:MAG: hypothetical protein CM15mV142_250 [Caudoviricetes sp.]